MTERSPDQEDDTAAAAPAAPASQAEAQPAEPAAPPQLDAPAPVESTPAAEATDGAPQPEAPSAPAAESERPPRTAVAGGERREPRDGGDRPERGDRRRRFGRRRICTFCVEKASVIDYKDPGKLRRYLSDRARIEPRRKTGTCAKHQRWLAVALKRARHLALLPYTPEHIRVLGGGRR